LSILCAAPIFRYLRLAPSETTVISSTHSAELCDRSERRTRQDEQAPICIDRGVTSHVAKDQLCGCHRYGSRHRCTRPEHGFGPWLRWWLARRRVGPSQLWFRNRLWVRLRSRLVLLAPVQLQVLLSQNRAPSSPRGAPRGLRLFLSRSAAGRTVSRSAPAFLAPGAAAADGEAYCCTKRSEYQGHEGALWRPLSFSGTGRAAKRA
jgi:hypothetical protein